jgi:small conductance mechanosensitive channel
MDKRRSKTFCSLFNNIIKYLILIFCILAILEVYNISTKGILTGVGVFGVVVGLAFQDILKDLLAGFSIIFENEYAVGDIITIGDFKGKVISLGLKTTKIQAITGEIKMISNRNVVEVINHSLDDSYIFIDIGVSYDDNVEKVEQVLNKIARNLEKEILNLKSIELQGINELGNSSVDFRLLVRTNANEQYEIKRKILKEIKLKFEEENITIPYNQVVIHNA